MVAWYTDTLLARPADPKTAVAAKDTPVRAFWRSAASAAGVADAVRMYEDHASRGERTVLFAEAQLNLLGYYHLLSGRANEAIQLFKLNTVAYPASANTFDSLGDAYLAAGQNELALRMSEKSLELLPNDRSDEARKAAIRESAQQKIAKLKKN
jgi:tetratricopeptide (TPR) repeat protein